MTDPHIIPSATLPNLRDVGGWPGAGDALIRPGVLYRSAALSDPGVATDGQLIDLGIATVVDMRTKGESSTAPDHVPHGADYLQVDILADSPDAGAAAPARLAAGDLDPKLLGALSDGEEFMGATYRAFVTDAVARQGFARVVRTLLEADGRPILVHCTAGKDRTGWATATLMLIAGAPHSAVLTEYLSVQPAVTALFAPQLDRASAAGIDPELLKPVLEVRESYLDAGMAEVGKNFGSFEGYLRDGLGLEVPELTRAREILTRY